MGIAIQAALIRVLPLLLLAVAIPGCGGSSPQGTHFEVDVLAAGLTTPTSIAVAPDGRLFVTEQHGVVKRIRNGGGESVLSLHAASDLEQGLVAMELDPSFGSNRFVYLYYTAGPQSTHPAPSPVNRLSRFIMNADVLDPASETMLLDGIPADRAVHNGGGLAFGPDGKLYLATGDGGNRPNAQDLSSLSGKILRLNRDGSPPADNPFVNQAGARPEIYALGLRNPFRIAFRPTTGALYIADVGQNAWEEVNLGVKGGNYGWPLAEGPDGTPGFLLPLYHYSHNGGQASITGGVFLTGNRFPESYRGSYFFGDYARWKVYRMAVDSQERPVSVEEFGPAEGISDFAEGLVDIAEGPDGSLLFLSHSRGILYRVRYL